MKTMSDEEQDVFENTTRSLKILQIESAKLTKTSNISEFNKEIDNLIYQLSNRKFKL